MTISVSDIKSFLRVTHSEDDAVLGVLLNTAKSFAQIKTGVEYVSGDLLYEQLLKYLVQHYYDNRSALNEKQSVEMPFTITDLIKTITYRGAVEAEENTEQTEQTETVENTEQIKQV